MGYSTFFLGKMSSNTPLPEDLAKTLVEMTKTDTRSKEWIWSARPKEDNMYYCDWELHDNQHWVHNGDEKFYDYVEWLEFIVDYTLKKAAHIKYNGKFFWQGQYTGDIGHIRIVNNVIYVQYYNTNTLDFNDWMVFNETV